MGYIKKLQQLEGKIIMVLRLKPSYIVEKVTDINLDDLKDEGIKGMLFDLDNTLMAPKSAKLTEDIANWIEAVKQDFKIAIVSNNPHPEYMEQAQKELSCPVYGKAKKPQKNVALTALKCIDLLPSQVAMIGDRPLTDIWLGQRLGMTTILVDPLIKHEEMAIVKFLRKLERIFIESPKNIFTDKNK